MVSASKSRTKKPLYVGIALILLGIFLNQRVIELLFVADGGLRNKLYINIIRAAQAMLIVGGGIIALRRPTLPKIKAAEIGMAFAGILLPLILLEIGVRVWLGHFATPAQFNKYALYTDIPANEFQWSPHPNLNHYPTPNFTRGLTSHNSLGFRGDEITTEKPEGVFRIAAVGGSTTYTVRVEDNDKSYPAQLERILREKFGYENVEVINAGVADYNSWDSIINLTFRVLPFEPDLIIIYHGTNDVHARLVEPDAYRPDDSGRRQQWSPPEIPLWQRSALLRAVSRIAGYSSQAVLGDFVNADSYVGWPHYGGGLDETALLDILEQNPPTYFERNLKNMVAISQANNAQALLATWAHSPNLGDYASTTPYTQGFEENNEAVKQVADLTGAPLFDFAGIMPQDENYWADGRHVNEAGALLKAELFAEFIHNEGLIE